ECSSVDPFRRLERCLQRVKALWPVRAVVVEPSVHPGERRGVERADVAPTLDPALDETGLLQHLDVLGYGRQRDGKRFGQLAHGALGTAQGRQDAATRGIR